MMSKAAARNVNALMAASYSYAPSAISETVSPELALAGLTQRFALPWSAYVRLLSVKHEHARHFYEVEALRGGWSVRQIDRQIGSQFYERTALSKNKAAVLTKGVVAKAEDVVTPEQAVKDPYVLEFPQQEIEKTRLMLEARSAAPKKRNRT